jgi:hypothetical protein
MRTVLRGALMAIAAAGLMSGTIASAASPHAPSAPVAVTWKTPNMATLTVRQGATIVRTVAFRSNVTITNAQPEVIITDWAKSHGVSATVRGVTPATTTFNANWSYHVTLAISAAPSAKIGFYGADVQVAGTVKGVAYAKIWHDLDFGMIVDVPSAPVAIRWTGPTLVAADGRIHVHRGGPTVTAMASFTSSMAISNARLEANVSDFAQSHGISVSVVGVSPAATTIAPNTVYQVTLALSATPTARVGYFGADLHVIGSVNGVAFPKLWHDLDFVVDIH